MKLLGVVVYLILLVLVLFHAGFSYYAVLQQNMRLEKVAYSQETTILILEAQRDRWRDSANECEKQLEQLKGGAK